MTEQTNAELLREAGLWGTNRAVANPRGAYEMIYRLAAALEAADRRAENAERQVEIRQNDSIAARIARQNARAVEEWVRVNQERDEYAAVVEKAERYCLNDDNANWQTVVAILATAPADALREHDAALIEAYQSQIRSTIGAFGDADGVWAFDSAVKTVEEARQRREERA